MTEENLNVDELEAVTEEAMAAVQEQLNILKGTGNLDALQKLAEDLSAEVADAKMQAAIENEGARYRAPTPKEVEESIVIQLKLAEERDRKRKEAALDAKTVNEQALDMIRERMDPSTKKDSESGGAVYATQPPGDTPQESTGEEGGSTEDGAGLSTAGTEDDAGVLFAEDGSVEAGNSTPESGPDDDSGEDNGPGASSSRDPFSNFLQ